MGKIPTKLRKNNVLENIGIFITLKYVTRANCTWF